MTLWELFCLAAITLLLMVAIPFTAYFTAVLIAYAIELGRWRFKRDHQHDERLNRNGKHESKA